MTRPGEYALEAEGLAKRFGPVHALRGVDLRARTGSVLGVLGPNGAGKTTAVRILATLLRPDAGSARVVGLDVVRRAAQVRRLIGLSGQYAALDGYLTARENLRMIARLSRMSRRDAHRRTDELLELFDLTAAADRLAGGYSGGMRRKLDVAAALVARPQVLFLDEPTTGLDPRGRAGLWTMIAGLADEGATVLLTTQYLEEADRSADQIVVIDQGEVIAAGSPDELKLRVGGNRLELHAAAGTNLADLAAAVASMGSAPPTIDPADSKVLLPVTDGTGVLPAVLSRLATTGLTLTDVAIRRPSLDEVFLSITRRPAEPDAADLAETGGAR